MSTTTTTSRTSWPLTLILLFLCCFHACFSPARSAKLVTRLPGFHGLLPFFLETGYVNVDEENGSELFYYFIESERSPSTDPVLLWLTGGDRCTAFSGLAYEIGPVRFVVEPYNGSLPQLVYNPYSWTKVANIIFLDSPVGAGFSFASNSKGYEVGDISSSLQVHKFLLKWFTDHPKYISNPLYIGGDSTAGKWTPFVAQIISEGIESGQQPLLNLKGYIVGNPITDAKFDVNAIIPCAHGFGIISDQIYEAILRKCKGEEYMNPSDKLCAKALNSAFKLIFEIDMAHVLEPRCILVSPRQRNTSERRKFLMEEYIHLRDPPARPPFNCRSYGYYLSYFWANDNATRYALGIRQGTVEEWHRCTGGLPYTREIDSSIKYHLNLTSRSYRALVYSGDHDLIVPFLGTHAWVRSLNFSILDDWRAYHLNGQAAGFTITYSNNMTFATIKGGGHTAPEYQPEECFAMAQRWLDHEPL